MFPVLLLLEAALMFARILSLSDTDTVVYLAEDDPVILADMEEDNHTYHSTFISNNLLDLHHKVCHHMISDRNITEVVVYSSCETAKLFNFMLQRMNATYKMLYTESCMSGLSHKMAKNNGSNHLIAFVMEAVRYFCFRSVVALLDLETGVSQNELQKRLSDQRVAATVLNVDKAQFNLTNTLYEADRNNNFLLLCNESNRKAILTEAYNQNQLSFPYNWLIVSNSLESVIDFLTEIKIPYAWNITVAHSTNAAYDKSLKHQSVATSIFTQDLDNAFNCSLATTDDRRTGSSRPRFEDQNNAWAVWGDSVHYQMTNVRIRCSREVINSTVARWTSNTGISEDKTEPNALLQLGKTEKLNSCNLTIGVAHNPPYVILPKNIPVNATTISKDLVKGIDAKIFAEIAAMLKFSYHFRLSNDSLININGTIDLLKRQKIDMMLPTLAMTLSRSKELDFTCHVTYTVGVVVIRNPHVKVTANDFTQPFSPMVWLALTVASVVTILVLGLTRARGRLHEMNDETNPNEQTHWWQSFYAVMCAVFQQGTDYPPQTYSGRIVLATFLITSLIMIQTYSSNLISFLTVNVAKLPFKTLDELAENRDYQIATTQLSSYREILQTSNDTGLKKVFERMSKSRSSVAMCLEQAEKGNFALMVGLTSVQNELVENDMIVVAIPNIVRTFNHFALKKDFPHSSSISTCINILRETGAIQRIFNQYVTQATTAELEDGAISDGKMTPITVANIEFLVYVVVTGLAAATVALLAEMILHRYVRGKRHTLHPTPPTTSALWRVKDEVAEKERVPAYNIETTYIIRRTLYK